MLAILTGISLALLVIILILVGLIKGLQKGMNGFYEENRKLRNLIGWEKK